MIADKSLAVLVGCIGSIGLLSWIRAASKSGSLAEEEDVLDLDYNKYALEKLKEYRFKTFETSGGSTYGVGNRQVTALRIGGSTKRNGPNDKQSAITYYVKPTDAKRLGQHLLGRRESDNIVLITNGAIFPLTRAAGGKLLSEAKDYKNPIMFSSYPLEGTSPLELWDEGEIEGKPTYQNWHAGSAITKVTRY